MILAPLVVLSLVVTATADTGVAKLPDHRSNSRTPQQKRTIMQPLVRTATACVTRTVAAEPRIQDSIKSADIRDLIVDSMPTCSAAMRAMIDAHDQLFGTGTGELFFTGPYLDALPS